MSGSESDDDEEEDEDDDEEEEEEEVKEPPVSCDGIRGIPITFVMQCTNNSRLSFNCRKEKRPLCPLRKDGQ